jgi:hypothetical protein
LENKENKRFLEKVFYLAVKEEMFEFCVLAGICLGDCKLIAEGLKYSKLDGRIEVRERKIKMVG